MEHIKHFLLLNKYTLIPVVVLAIAAFWTISNIPGSRAEKFQRVARIEVIASMVRFSNDSQSFFVRTYNDTLCHYDIKGNLLGQIKFQGKSISDFYVSADDKKLGMLVQEHVFDNEKCVANPIDFVVVDIEDMTIAKKVNLFTGYAESLNKGVLFSPTTESWIAYYSDVDKDKTKYTFFALKSDNLEKQAENVITSKSYPMHIYCVPEVEGIIGIKFSDTSQHWNYLTNELMERPAKSTISETASESKFFSGPFSRTIAALGTYQESVCFLVFPFDSDTPLYYSAPLPENVKPPRASWAQVVGISDDFNIVLFFSSPIGAVLSPPPHQRLFVSDVPSMQVFAELTNRRGVLSFNGDAFIRDAFLSPDGRHVVTVGRSRKPAYWINIYDVSTPDLRPAEEWRTVNPL